MCIIDQQCQLHTSMHMYKHCVMYYSPPLYCPQIYNCAVDTTPIFCLQSDNCGGCQVPAKLHITAIELHILPNTTVVLVSKDNFLCTARVIHT